MLASAPAGSKIYALQQLRKFIRSSEVQSWSFGLILSLLGMIVKVTF